MSMDPHNGQVKAYVGGPDSLNSSMTWSMFGRRQVGSTVKPYLYTWPMEEGMWPCDKNNIATVTLIDGNGKPWTPKNVSNKDKIGQPVSLRWGLANSNNWISAYLMSLFTPGSLVKLMRSFGIRGQLDPVVSLCLGHVKYR